MEEYMQMIEDCEERESCLSEWEAGFISSMRNWLEQNKRPTPRQEEAINRIWNKATARG